MVPLKPTGCMRRGLCSARAARASASSRMGGPSGYWAHQASPASISSSVELLAGDRSQLEKRSGGGGKSEVSGTAACQLCCCCCCCCCCCFCSCFGGGDPGGGAV